MANPPIENRRPGVDASTVQADWVRGYDAPAAANPPQVPCDLLISNGLDQVNGDVSNVVFWNRTDDRTIPMFQLAPGSDLAAAPIFNVHAGTLASPDAIITSPLGSLYLSNSPPGLFQNTDGGTTWVKISDDLGGEDLAATLVIGNFTGGTNIIITDGDEIRGEDDNTGSDGGDVGIRGGGATGGAGDGGGITLNTGVSAAGNTGNLQLFTPSPSGSGNSGTFLVQTGTSLVGGNGGEIVLRGGGGAQGAEVNLYGGDGPTGTDRGGRIGLWGGDSLSTGDGASINIVGGSATTPPGISNVFNPGQGGNVNLWGGNSADGVDGGLVFLQGGSGGPLGGEGGDVFLRPGSGGGGADDGLVRAIGIFEADNIKRGTGDPNANTVPGNEGDIYQRLDGGDGQLWLNVLGSPTGWQKMALSGDFISSWQQMQWGYLSPRVGDSGGADDTNLSDLGIYQGVGFNTSGGGGDTDAQVTSTFNGVQLRMESSVQNSVIGLDATAVGTATTRTDHRFIALFRMQPEPSTGFNQPPVGTYFWGFSTNPVTSQVTNTTVTPGAGDYYGFAFGPGFARCRIVSRQSGSGLVSNIDTAVGHFAAGGQGYYYAIDTTDYLNSIRFTILDDDLQVLEAVQIDVSSNTLPLSTGILGPCIGTTLDIGAPDVTLQHYLASITTNADLVAQGAGPTSNLSLSQVLTNGNNTGSNFIEVQHARGLIGETDGNAGSGADYSILSGSTTGAATDTGNLTVSTASHTVAAASGDSGGVIVASGNMSSGTATGDTGNVLIQSGIHAGTSGSSGDLAIYSGDFSGAGGVGATVGDIVIAVGTPGVNPAVPGLLDIRGGSTSLAATSGGAITIQSGESTGASGNTGAIALFTPDVNQNGTAGSITAVAGDGGVVSGSGGPITVRTGAGTAGAGGAILVTTGAGGNGVGGSFALLLGDSAVGNGPDIVLVPGDTADVGGTGGDVVVIPGTGGLSNGQFQVQGDAEITGKLTVLGSIDPDAVGFKGVLANPLPINPGTIDGVIWVDTNVAPSKLVFTDDTGADTDLGSGGATALNDLTDVVIAAPLNGQVLTYSGGTWVNLAGAGGSPLSTILGLGNTTGNTAGGIVVSTGDTIDGQTDLALNPGGGAGDRVVLEGLSWPKTDGLANYVLTTDGAGDLSFQPGGGGGGTATFAEAFASMQFGEWSAWATGAATPIGVLDNLTGTFNATTETANGGTTGTGADGTFSTYITLGLGTDGGIFTGPIGGVPSDTRLWTSIKFNCSAPGLMNMFAGLTTAPTLPAQLAFPGTPVEDYIGIQLVTDAPSSQATFHFVTDDATGVPLQVDTGIAPGGTPVWIDIDWTTPAQVTLTLYDNTRTSLATTTFAVQLPTPGTFLTHMVAIQTREAAAKSITPYSVTNIARADTLAALGGGGGLQNLASVLALGAETGGTPIQGDDNAGGSGSALDLRGGTSTGGGGSGGDVILLGGVPEIGSTGDGGGFIFTSAGGASGGAGGDGGAFTINLGVGDGTGGSGGAFSMLAGPGAGTGSGGDVLMSSGPGGGTGGAPGNFTLATGSAIGGDVGGGIFDVTTGPGAGTGEGGAINFATGAGGATNAAGGDFTISLGLGGGAGAPGQFIVAGDATITGKLTVVGNIDPPSLLMSSSGLVPFTPAGFEGGIWVNALGELIYTNTGGDLNLSTAIGGGMTFLDGLLQAAYGFMGPGSSGTPLASYGVLGGGVTNITNVGAVTSWGGVGGLQDPDGPVLNLAVGAGATSTNYVATSDAMVRVDMRFKSVFKFQVNSAAQLDQRIFIGLTDDPTTQVSSGVTDDPPANQYVGIRQDLGGLVFDFVGRGSGGALAPALAIPTDALVHYLVIDSIDGINVNMQILAADGITPETPVFVTAIGTFTVPDATLPIFSQVGLYTDTGTVPLDVDFYFHTVVTGANIIDAVTGGGGGGGVDTLQEVLIAGNVTGGMDLAVTAGDVIRGDTTSLNLAGGTAGGAGIVGSITIGANSGDTGGGIDVKGGAGAGGAGVGGGALVVAGDGAGTGSGGTARLTAGAGGPVGGLAGNATVTGGPGTFGGVAGGTVTLQGGDATGGDPTDRGGTVVLRPGESTVAMGGSAGVVLIGVDATLVPVDGADGVGVTDGGNGTSIASILGGGGDNASGNAGDGGSWTFTATVGGSGLEGVSPVSGGTGGAFTFTGAEGGPASHTTGVAVGGVSTRFDLLLADGGSAAGTTGATGGGGGTIFLVSGSGGATNTSTSGVSAAGNAGEFDSTLGDGGNAATTVAGTSTGGDGGFYIFKSGAGGNAAGGTVAGSGGAGGGFSIFTAPGGNSVSADNAGGNGGTFDAILGVGGDGTGTEDGGDGGNFTVTAGGSGPALGAGAEGSPGDIILTAGVATGVFSGFSRLQGGGGPITAHGGSVEIAGGDIGPAPAFGAFFSAGTGGIARVRGGAGDSSAAGGGVIVIGGPSGPALAADGGIVTITGGPSISVTGDGGDVRINPATSVGGALGQLEINSQTRINGAGFKHGTFAAAGAVAPALTTHVYGVGVLAAYTPFPAVPGAAITMTLAVEWPFGVFPAPPFPTVALVPAVPGLAATAADFTLTWDFAPPPGTLVHWSARLS